MKKRPTLVLKDKIREDKLLQKLLPLFSEDVTLINSLIGFSKRNGVVYYFNGQMPLFSHEEDDIDSFKMYMAQLYVQGNVSQSEINKVFKLNPINMKRWTQKFLTGGPGSFYRKERTYTPRNSVLTEPVIQKVQSLLDEGYGVSKIGKELNLKADTLRKAIGAGKLYRSTSSTSRTSRTSRTTRDNKDNNDEEKLKKNRRVEYKER